MKLDYATSAGGIRAENLAIDPAASLREQSPEQARELRKQDRKRWSANVTVTVLIPELGRVKAESDDGLLSLSISERTAGVSLRDLQPGQHLCVTLEGVLAPRVLSAALA